MTVTTRRFATYARLPIMAVSAVMALSAAAAVAAQTEPAFPYLATVTADDENVRAGAHFRYYPFGRLDNGDVVKVIGHKGNWARVTAVGPAFSDFFAYIKYPVTDTGHLRLNEDATSGRTLVPVDLFAPNLDAGYEPKSSWKPLITLPAGVTVPVAQTRQVRGERVHRVPLPTDAQGWVNLDHLRRATPAEHAAWEAALASRETTTMSPSDPKPVVASPPPAVAQAAPPAQGVLARDEVQRVGVAPVEEIAGPPIPQGQVQMAKPRRPLIPGAAARKLDELEAAYRDLLAAPVEHAEVNGLRLQYLELARQHRSHKTVVEYAQDRARQLELWAEVHQQQSDLSRLLERSRLAAQEADEARWSLESAAGYLVIGRLEPSRVYDGEKLPKLLRLRDPATGRSIAYIRMDDRFPLADLLGKLVGISGDQNYDGTLRLNVLRPNRIEVLTPVAGEMEPTASAEEVAE